MGALGCSSLLLLDLVSLDMEASEFPVLGDNPFDRRVFDFLDLALKLVFPGLGYHSFEMKAFDFLDLALFLQMEFRGLD